MRHLKSLPLYPCFPESENPQGARSVLGMRKGRAAQLQHPVVRKNGTATHGILSGHKKEGQPGWEAQSLGAPSCAPKVYGFNPRSGCIEEATNGCFSFTSMFLSLSPPSEIYHWLKIKKKKKNGAVIGASMWINLKTLC